MTNNTPSVDILLVTFNHSNYIDQALESVKFQDYGGPVRLVVADDCSTDGTLHKIRKFVASNERLGCVILPTERNVGITANYKRGFAACKADYVAVLEGDDYWSSTRKLSKQIAFLQEHRGYAACASNFFIVDNEKAHHRLRIDRTDGYLVITPTILIGDNLIGNFSTCVYRRSALRKLPDRLFEMKSYDWIVNICTSMQGPIGYLGEPLSVYRQHASGTWSSSSRASKVREQLELIPQYDKLTGGHFSKEFTNLENHLRSLRIPEPGGSGISSISMSAKGEAAFRRVMRAIVSFTPPIIKWTIKALLPPRLFASLVQRSI